VVKGGKNMSFRAVVVVGDKKGHVGVGVGKALEVSDAVIKAVINGRRNIVTVPLTKHLTFPHRSISFFLSFIYFSQVILALMLLRNIIISDASMPSFTWCCNLHYATEIWENYCFSRSSSQFILCYPNCGLSSKEGD
jgi:Ribosomal protein S5, N-terminal domain